MSCIFFSPSDNQPLLFYPWLGSYFGMCASAHCRAERANRQSTAPLTGLGPGFGAQASRGLREYEMCATSFDTPFSGSFRECCECSQRHVERVIGLDSSIKKGRPAVVDTFFITINIIDLHLKTKDQHLLSNPTQPSLSLGHINNQPPRPSQPYKQPSNTLLLTFLTHHHQNAVLHHSPRSDHLCHGPPHSLPHLPRRERILHGQGYKGHRVDRQ